MGEIMNALQDKDKRANGLNLRFSSGLVRDNPSYCFDNGHVDPERPRFWLAASAQGPRINFGRGSRWADCLPIMSGVMTILPPNREACGRFNALGTTLVATMSSRHQGGAHILMGDGAVVFMTDSVEAGNSASGMVWHNGTGPQAPGSKSPYGLWGALGTRASGEVIEEQLNQ